ncbi:MAG: 3-hydroxyacyl-CoA dehydrogenase family protein [Myxococcota bacterium]
MTGPKERIDPGGAEERRFLVIGAGTMGRGIAQVAAAAGFEARLVDVRPGAAARAKEAIAAATARRVARGKMDEATRAALLARAVAFDSLDAAAEEVDVVVEAVVEDLTVKTEVLRRAAARARGHALLASNTSSLSITELGMRVGEGERLIGTHFFNPPPAMALLELVRGLHTREETMARGRGLATRLGKTAIEVRDTPGFATSRLGVVLGAEAIRMVETGVAPVADIDRAMELGYRHPMGPLKLGDLVGLDVRLAILEHLHREVGEAFRPPALLRQMVRAGWTGKKAGRGFYRWPRDGGPPVPTDPMAGR